MNTARPFGKKMRAEQANNFLRGLIPVDDINKVILAYNDCFEGTLARTLHPSNKDIRSLVALDPRGYFTSNALATLNDDTLICGSYTTTVHVDPLEGDRGRTLTNNDRPMQSMAVLPDGKLVLGFPSGEVRVFEDDVCVNTFTAHNTSVSALAAMPDGKLASGSRDDIVCL